MDGCEGKASMTCQLNQPSCCGTVSTYSFVWHFVPHERDRNRFRAGDTTVECLLCEKHHQQLLQENNGVVPETSGASRLAAIDNLTMLLNDVIDAEYCVQCVGYTIGRCERCGETVCGDCLFYHSC